MLYKDFQGKALSSLGLGTMRLPQTPDGAIDRDHTENMIAYALAHGINYFDTAWKYHGGNSETVIGEILSKYPRESYYLADKFPGFDLSLFDQMEEIFFTQLKKCNVDYFDFYLCHNVCERNLDAYLDKDKGAIAFFLKQKEEGRIKHLGFSTHAELPALEKFLEAHGNSMEYCQIQLNYLDWDWQKAKEKVDLLRKYDLKVWVMEPLRGGDLVELPEKSMEKFRTIIKDLSPREAAFAFLRSIPEVTMILSGMSNMQQLQENIAFFSEECTLSAEAFQKLPAIGREMIEAVPCTACHYCTEYCPQKLDIPKLMRLYNENRFDGSTYALNLLSPDKRPSACLGCGGCEAVCPQNIPIPEKLKELAQKEKSYSSGTS